MPSHLTEPNFITKNTMSPFYEVMKLEIGFELAKISPDVNDRSRIFSKILLTLSRSFDLKKDLEFAIDVAMEFPDNKLKSSGLYFIVTKLADEDIERAIALAELIPDEHTQAWAYRDIANAYTKLGDTKKAEIVAKTIQHIDIPKEGYVFPWDLYVFPKDLDEKTL